MTERYEDKLHKSALIGIASSGLPAGLNMHRVTEIPSKEHNPAIPKLSLKEKIQIILKRRKRNIYLVNLIK